MIDLPTTPLAQSATPRYVDFGSIQKSVLGGPDQRINRLGNRFAVDYKMPPMNADDAALWVGRLIRAKGELTRFYFPQPGLALPNAAGVTVDPFVSGDEEISITGFNNLSEAKEGWFLSLVTISGVWSLHQLTADISAPGTVGIWPPVRRDRPTATNGYFQAAAIEGYVQGDELSWDVGTAQKVGLSFTIAEAE